MEVYDIASENRTVSVTDIMEELECDREAVYEHLRRLTEFGDFESRACELERGSEVKYTRNRAPMGRTWIRGVSHGLIRD